MGPRPEGRGDPHRPVKIKLDDLASMGPRPEGRGDNLYLDNGKDFRSLQWGHGPKAVETTRRSPLNSGTGSFNGATARRPWRHH